MNDQLPPAAAPAPMTGNISDFVYGGASKENPLFMEISINEKMQVMLFHNKTFKNELSWLEFDLSTNALDFVLDDGDIRDIGISLSKDVSKYMQNTHQVLMVLMDDQTGDAKEGRYIPLIVHRS